MQQVKNFLKEVTPPILVRAIRSKPVEKYGWFGEYNSWGQAKAASGGYDDVAILEKVKKSLLKVKNGQAVHERDSVLFDRIEYSWPVLASLMWIAANNRGKLNLIDFGGSLGSTFFQNRFFLETLSQVRWNIVEQGHFVKCGKSHFENNRLGFYETIEQCVTEQNPDTILLSSVIQYFEKPYELVRNIINKNFTYVIIDRTLFSAVDRDILTVQRVPPTIYDASYPCWFLSETKFRNLFEDKYRLIADFSALDNANIPSTFKGFIFQK